MSYSPETRGTELEEWLQHRINDLETYRETDSPQEYDNTLERIQTAVNTILHNSKATQQ